MAEDRERLRRTFGTVAERYDRARPAYPEPLIDDLVELAGLHEGARVLEIGCGTGQATRALAARGLAVTCVELSPDLAVLAARNVPAADVDVANFETWEPDRADFDAVTAFTAFHWIAPELRYTKTARLLRPGGALAVVGAEHALPPDGDSFWVEVQEDYDTVAPHPDNRPPPPPDEIGDLREEFDASGLFEPATSRRHLWDVTYTADEYIAVLGTYSGHLLLPEEQRNELLDRIHRRVSKQGTVTKTYVGVLTVARRR